MCLLGCCGPIWVGRSPLAFAVPVLVCATCLQRCLWYPWCHWLLSVSFASCVLGWFRWFRFFAFRRRTFTPFGGSASRWRAWPWSGHGAMEGTWVWLCQQGEVEQGCCRVRGGCWLWQGGGVKAREEDGSGKLGLTERMGACCVWAWVLVLYGKGFVVGFHQCVFQVHDSRCPVRVQRCAGYHCDQGEEKKRLGPCCFWACV